MIFIDLAHLSSSHHLIRFDSPCVCISFASRMQSFHHSHSDANAVEIGSLAYFWWQYAPPSCVCWPFSTSCDEVTRLVTLSEHIVFIQLHYSVILIAWLGIARAKHSCKTQQLWRASYTAVSLTACVRWSGDGSTFIFFIHTHKKPPRTITPITWRIVQHLTTPEHNFQGRAPDRLCRLKGLPR